DRWLPPSTEPAPATTLPPALQDAPAPALASRWMPDDNSTASVRDTSARPAEPPRIEPPPWTVSEPQPPEAIEPTMESPVEGPVPVPRPKPRLAANRLPGYVPVPRARPDNIPAPSSPSIFGLFTPATPGE